MKTLELGVVTGQALWKFLRPLTLYEGAKVGRKREKKSNRTAGQPDTRAAGSVGLWIPRVGQGRAAPESCLAAGRQPLSLRSLVWVRGPPSKISAALIASPDLHLTIAAIRGQRCKDKCPAVSRQAAGKTLESLGGLLTESLFSVQTRSGSDSCRGGSGKPGFSDVRPRPAGGHSRSGRALLAGRRPHRSMATAVSSGPDGAQVEAALRDMERIFSVFSDADAPSQRVAGRVRPGAEPQRSLACARHF